MKESWLKYIINILIAACGFFIVAQIQGTNTRLSQINSDILELKIDVSQLRSSIISEDRIIDLIEVQLLKHGIKD